MLNAYYYFKQANPSYTEDSLNEVTENQASSDVKPPFILCFGFNQIFTHFVVGTQRGYHVFSIKPFAHRAHMFFKQALTDSTSKPAEMVYGGIGIVEMLFRSNIFALVGGGPRPAFPPNKILLWDDQLKQCLGEIASAKPIKAVKLHKNLLVVVTEDTITVYDHELKQSQPKPFGTAYNPKGICALSPDTDNIVLAFPHVQKGMVQLENLSTQKKKHIKAHDNEIMCLTLSRDGAKLATASEKGTLIRVFDTENGTLIKEVRRGSSKAEIYSIAFSTDSNYLCCVSSSGTLHVFAISDVEGKTPNRTSSLSFFSYVMDVKYVNSEWSFAEYRGIDSPGICCFGTDNRIIRVLTAKGVLYELTFDLEKGGEPIKVATYSCEEFLHMEDDKK